MDPREAVKGTVRLFLKSLVEKDKMEWLEEDDLDKVIEQMHDDDQFLSALEEFIEDHIHDFGENYGI